MFNDASTYYHTSADTSAVVPTPGLEASARAFAQRSSTRRTGCLERWRSTNLDDHSTDDRAVLVGGTHAVRCRFVCSVFRPSAALIERDARIGAGGACRARRRRR